MGENVSAHAISYSGRLHDFTFRWATMQIINHVDVGPASRRRKYNHLLVSRAHATFKYDHDDSLIANARHINLSLLG